MTKPAESQNAATMRVYDGGPERDRTADLVIANLNPAIFSLQPSPPSNALH